MHTSITGSGASWYRRFPSTRLGHYRDLHRRVQRHLVDAEGGTGVLPAVAEHGEEKFRRAIEHLRVLMETGGGVDEPFEAHDSGDPVKPARRGLELGDRVDRANA